MKASLKSTAVVVALAFGAAGAAHAQQQKQSPGQQGGGTVVSVKPDYTESMEKLRASAQELRESIQALAQKKPGPDRDAAISQAHEALYETQRAMLALPPDLRSHGTVSTADYDKSVKQLMSAADRLRGSIQAMAQQKPGEGRNKAIDQARQALWDTQQAMMFAFNPGRSAAAGAGR